MLHARLRHGSQHSNPPDHPEPQAFALGAHMQRLHSTAQADVVIVSPLTRALETAAAVFGNHQIDAAEADSVDSVLMHARPMIKVSGNVRGVIDLAVTDRSMPLHLDGTDAGNVVRLDRASIRHNVRSRQQGALPSSPGRYEEIEQCMMKILCAMHLD